MNDQEKENVRQVLADILEPLRRIEEAIKNGNKDIIKEAVQKAVIETEASMKNNKVMDIDIAKLKAALLLFAAEWLPMVGAIKSIIELCVAIDPNVIDKISRLWAVLQIISLPILSKVRQVLKEQNVTEGLRNTHEQRNATSNENQKENKNSQKHGVTPNTTSTKENAEANHTNNKKNEFCKL